MEETVDNLANKEQKAAPLQIQTLLFPLSFPLLKKSRNWYLITFFTMRFPKTLHLYGLIKTVTFLISLLFAGEFNSRLI